MNKFCIGKELYIIKEENMRKHWIKKSAVCAAAMGISLLLAACGGAAQTENGKNDAETDDTQAAGDDARNTPDNADTTSGGQAETAEGGVTVTAEETPVTVTMQTETEEMSLDDGTLYYVSEWSYPAVSIEGNDDAADRINEDIRAQVDTFTENMPYVDEAKEYSAGIAYEYDLSYTVMRADENVISFVTNQYTFTGGAHGLNLTSGVSYSTKTGERIAFTDLSGNPDTFHADTLAYLQELAATDAYGERLFSVDDITNGTMESVLYADGNWYLSRAGLVFLSNPYDLGPYAGGLIEFTIPYEKLADMGWKDDYAYSGRRVQAYAERETAEADLDGDGTLDSVCLLNEYEDSADGTDGMTTKSYLVINDTGYPVYDSSAVVVMPLDSNEAETTSADETDNADKADDTDNADKTVATDSANDTSTVNDTDSTDEAGSAGDTDSAEAANDDCILPEMPWRLIVYDLDTADASIEAALECTYDNRCYFFRYTGDGIDCLGYVNGDITDLSFTFTSLVTE